METVVLIDGAFIRKKFRSALKKDILSSDIQQREGILSFNGWTLKPACYGMNPLADDCFSPNLKQKGVDIKIGLDVAWVSFNRIASGIIMITGGFRLCSRDQDCPPQRCFCIFVYPGAQRKKRAS